MDSKRGLRGVSGEVGTKEFFVVYVFFKIRSCVFCFRVVAWVFSIGV